MFLAMYVDDGLIAAANEDDITPVIEFLGKKFEIKFFEAKCFLGLELSESQDGGLIVRQSAYARKVLRKFNMLEANKVTTPTDINQVIGVFGDSELTQFPYREAVGSLIYLAVATRPDIAFAVGVVSRFLERPTAAHVNAIKRIMKYIKATLDYGIRFDRRIKLKLCGYSDADYAGDTETRRSTSGYVFFSWKWCYQLVLRKTKIGRTINHRVRVYGSFKCWLVNFL